MSARFTLSSSPTRMGNAERSSIHPPRSDAATATASTHESTHRAIPHSIRSARSPLALAWIAAAWMGLVGNWPLWSRMLQMPELAGPSGLRFIAVFAALVTLLTGALLSLFAWRGAIKPVLTLLVPLTAVLAYFIGCYGVVVDSGMLVNALQTDWRETRDLLTGWLFVEVLALAVLPLWWLWRQPVSRARWYPRLGVNLLSLALALGIGVALAALQSAQLASTLRNHKGLTKMVSPLNALWATAALATQAAPRSGPLEVVGRHATLAPRPAGSRPPLIVLVLGETARADHFSLNGYERNTNPALASLGVVSFRNVTSCGTSTAASVPCMFSALGREEFVKSSRRQENLLDVLQRAGLAVLWVDNQSGCKGVCERVPQARASAAARAERPFPAGLCLADGVCFDEALVHDLDGRLLQLDPERVARGVVLVLHQMGSHGPAYADRSPPAFKRFVPECRSSELQRCELSEVRNAYDNSLLYTDHVLGQVIGWLKTQQARFDPAMVYVSDHGESLGENHVYLHGMPYGIAPKEQTHVPLVMWMGDWARADPAGQREARVDRDCLARRAQEAALSHDGLFPTILQLAGVVSGDGMDTWSWMQGCRKG